MEQQVKIQTHQVVKQGDTKQQYTYQTQGLRVRKNAEFIRYDETIEGTAVNVTVKITDEGVKIIRKGDVHMTLHLLEGQQTTSYYHIPEGKVVFTVETLRVLHFLTATGGKLKVHYKLYQGDDPIGTYQYELTYEEC
ncbi:DUF1934 domain-containing protein [Staphylococcus rostri]|uniref:DUF1934 domain-containing protein n=1 Tax=Staphylococcus rostri TaxID=522262 RepID=A0A2K3YPU3_9STAP|nr:DUF1934 family protein [Staphylococcus rostri]PNZ27601.1 DUF1934 domain-containing protein [Staphylococcus rostri]